MAWTPHTDLPDYAKVLLSPVYNTRNFRPPGALYFRWMTKLVGAEFALWIPPLFMLHLATATLLYLLLLRLGITEWSAWLGTAFFVLSGAAMDAFWKPMYVFDLLCGLFSIACLLLYARRQWVLSFVAYWLAYKSKELAVMLPAVLLLYEYLLGERKYLRAAPFLAASLSFGVQGILMNPNKDNDYTFRFTPDAVRLTFPYYVHRFLDFRGSGLALGGLLLVRDRRVWLGLGGTLIVLSLLLFLPGRRFEAYGYLPLALAAIALATGAMKHPRLATALFVLWLPWNAWVIRGEQAQTLAAGDQIASFAGPIERWARQHPEVRTLVYDGSPPTFHHWGTTGVWNYGHDTLGLKAWPAGSPEIREAMEQGPVAMARWNERNNRILIVKREP